MGLLQHFFMNKDVERQVKYWVYLSGPANTLLWGCKSWNLTNKNLRCLKYFHLLAVRRILGIKWEQVIENKTKNEEV